MSNQAVDEHWSFLCLNKILAVNFNIYEWHIFLDNARIINRISSEKYMGILDDGTVVDSSGNKYGFILDYTAI